MHYLIFFISASILFIAFYLLNTMPKYAKEKNNQTTTNESISIEGSTWCAFTTEEEETFIGKGVWLCLMIIISFNVNAQYVGVSVINKGIGVNAGILSDNVNIQAALTFPITNLTNSNTYSLTAGYQLNLTNDDADNYTVTPSIGAALVRSRSWDAKDAVTVTDNIKPMYGVEVGKDAFMGRVFLTGNYSDALYYGVGMKVFFNR